MLSKTDQAVDRRISVKRVLGYRDKIMSRVEDLVDSEFDAEVIKAFHTAAVDSLPKNCDKSAIYRSVAVNAGVKMSRQDLLMLAWLLAGNTHLLRRGSQVYSWRFQRSREWVGARIEAAIPAVVAGRVGGRLKFRIIYGEAAGRVAEKFFSNKASLMLAYKLGFGKKPRSATQMMPLRQYHEMREMVGLMLDILICPELSDKDRCPAFFHFRVGGKQQSDNRKFLDRREPRSRVCPRNKPKNFACMMCSAGTKECELAVHPSPLVWKKCKNCKRESPFALYVTDQVCYICCQRKK